ncbi:MAG: SPOR domain-containing protein [Qipengyuania sp.]
MIAQIVGRAARGLAMGCVLAAATPALADVKAGVDAWSAGDYATAVREWSGPAQAGDPDAQFNLAQAYRLGRGVEPDLGQAEALYRLAAAQGHVKAADNYGLLLFQSGRRTEAMPYIDAAAGRGDPRAQYLLGIAHFNGDLVEKDWGRAYALLTLANATGLPQARSAITQMDEYIPLADRQEAQLLAQRLKADAEARRSRQLAAVDLEMGAPQQVAAPVAIAPPPLPPRAGTATPVTVARGPAQAGADFTLPAGEPPIIETAVVPPSITQPGLAVTRDAPAPDAPAAMRGPWKVQLGAFGVAENADRLWQRIQGHAALAGATRENVSAGRLTKLMASGFPTREAAEQACNALKRSRQDCLVTR